MRYATAIAVLVKAMNANARGAAFFEGYQAVRP